MTELSKEQRRLSQTVEIYQTYKTVLSENNEQWLLRCDKCMINGDN